MDEYLEIYSNKIKSIYESYEPKVEVIEKINNLLENKNQELKIVTLGADWCPDCSRNTPKMIKIIKYLNMGAVNMHILYGIMVNALHKPGETIWHKDHSPTEAVNPKFDLKKIPTIYFFDKMGEYLGVIVENPKRGSTLEEEILEIIVENI